MQKECVFQSAENTALFYHLQIIQFVDSLRLPDLAHAQLGLRECGICGCVREELRFEAEAAAPWERLAALADERFLCEGVARVELHADLRRVAGEGKPRFP